MADAVLNSLSQLDNPERYEVIRGVPIFKAHVRKRGETTITVTDDDLSTIANRMEALEKNFGVCGRITDGHVLPPSQRQANYVDPPLFGFMRNARAANYGPSNERGVLVDYYIRREHSKTIRDRPFRSPEYYPPTKEIRGCAVLLHEPALDMGIVTYAVATDEATYLYAMANELPQGEKMAEVNTITPEMYAKSQADIEAANKKLADAEAKLNRQDCERLLDGLEKYEFDRDEELAILISRDEAGRKKRVESIKKNAKQKQETVEPIEVYDGDEDDKKGMAVQYAEEDCDGKTHPSMMKPAILEAAINYTRDNPGCSWNDAVKAAKAAK